MINKQEVLSLMRKKPIGNRWCYSIDSCIDKQSEWGKRGQINICIVFDDNEDGARERCYNSFVEAYNKGMIKEDLV